MRKILLSVLGICACTTLSLHADYDEEEAIAPRSTPPARTKIDHPTAILLVNNNKMSMWL